MTGAERLTVAKKKTSLCLVSLMLLSLLSALLTVPAVAAIEQVDLAILDGQSPVENRNYAAFDPITFSAEVENQALGPQTSTRTLDWFVCSGMKTATQCVSNDIANGQININGLLNGDSNNFTDATQWYPNGVTGVFTVVFNLLCTLTQATMSLHTTSISLLNTATYLSTKTKTLGDALWLAYHDGEFVLNTECYVMSILVLLTLAAVWAHR